MKCDNLAKSSDVCHFKNHKDIFYAKDQSGGVFCVVTFVMFSADTLNWHMSAVRTARPCNKVTRMLVPDQVSSFSRSGGSYSHLSIHPSIHPFIILDFFFFWNLQSTFCSLWKEESLEETHTWTPCSNTAHLHRHSQVDTSRRQELVTDGQPDAWPWVTKGKWWFSKRPRDEIKTKRSSHLKNWLHSWLMCFSVCSSLLKS